MGTYIRKVNHCQKANRNAVADLEVIEKSNDHALKQHEACHFVAPVDCCPVVFSSRLLPYDCPFLWNRSRESAYEPVTSFASNEVVVRLVSVPECTRKTKIEK